MGGPGRKELRSIRLRAETSPGNRGSPRYLWRGVGETVEDQREVVMVEEQVGIFGGTDRSYIPKLMAQIELAETEATFEQLGDILLMAGLGTNGGNWAGSAQGASGSTVVQTLIIPAAASFPNYSYTVEAGDSEPGGGNGWAEVVEYGLADEVSLTFDGGDALKVSATLVGRQGTATNALGTFTNAGTLPTVEVILASRGSAWLTPVGSGWGTGQVPAGNILKGELTLKPKWARKFPVDAGQIYFHTAVFAGMDIEGKLTLEYQATGSYSAAGSIGQMEKFRGEVPQLLQMTWRGGTITEGTTYENKELTIRLPIKYTEVSALDDMDGNDVREFTFVSKYNEATSAAGRGSITVVRLGTSEFSGA